MYNPIVYQMSALIWICNLQRIYIQWARLTVSAPPAESDSNQIGPPQCFNVRAARNSSAAHSSFRWWYNKPVFARLFRSILGYHRPSSWFSNGIQLSSRKKTTRGDSETVQTCGKMILDGASPGWILPWPDGQFIMVFLCRHWPTAKTLELVSPPLLSPFSAKKPRRSKYHVVFYI